MEESIPLTEQVRAENNARLENIVKSICSLAYKQDTVPMLGKKELIGRLGKALPRIAKYIGMANTTPDWLADVYSAGEDKTTQCWVAYYNNATTSCEVCLFHSTYADKSTYAVGFVERVVNRDTYRYLADHDIRLDITTHNNESIHQHILCGWREIPDEEHRMRRMRDSVASVIDMLAFRIAYDNLYCPLT